MMKWSPAQYEKFQIQRQQPAIDLLARLAPENPKNVTDLGCGTGSHAPRIKAMWPDCTYTGVDMSTQMLKQAQQHDPDAHWVAADINNWQPDTPVDLIFSNAALHWVPDHQTLIPGLVHQLNPGGVIAVQMPASFNLPVHTLIRDTVLQSPFDGFSTQAAAGILNADAYYDLLATIAEDINIWETVYIHILDGPNPVLEWAKGTALLPVLKALPETLHSHFINAYGQALLKAYPRRPDGKTLLPFRRLFITARAK